LQRWRNVECHDSGSRRRSNVPLLRSHQALGTVTGTIPGTSVLCTSYWRWHVSYPPTGGYSEVEWTSNPCGFRIEDRSYCESAIHPGNEHWNYSGIVKSTYLWDKAGCGITEVISGAQERFENGSSWSGWNQYWSR
jgi:hypothetical protein